MIATSNQDLPADLHERLSQHMLHVPPLYWRLDDVPLLVKHFLAGSDALYQRRLPIAGKCYEMVSNGKQSVRELKASIQRLKVAAEEPLVTGSGDNVERSRVVEIRADAGDSSRALQSVHPFLVLSPDYRRVSLHGEIFDLTGPQAEVIQFLHEAHENDTAPLSQEYILTTLNHESSRLSDVFRSRPKAWKRLLSRPRTGFFSLNL